MTRRILLLLVAVGVLAAAVVLAGRVRLEARYRAVEIVLDGDDWLSLIRREGADPAAVLQDLRGRGAVSIALADNTLRRLADDGRVTYASGPALISASRQVQLSGPLRSWYDAGKVRPAAVYITAAADDLTFVAQRLTALLGSRRVRVDGAVIEAIGSLPELEELGLGFRGQDAALAREAGLAVVLRPRNYRGLTVANLRLMADGYAETGAEPTLIFALTEVGGFEGLIDEAAAEYRRVGARFGRIEVFTARRKQRGEDRLTALMTPSVIRVFSITPEELQVLRPVDVVDRFVRAAQERNIRLLYVRPLLATTAGVDPLETNLTLVQSIAADLRQFGFVTTRSRPLPPLEMPTPLVWLVAVGALALSLLVLDDLARALGAPLAPATPWVLLIAGLIATIGATLTPLGLTWRQLLALGVAVTGATGAVVWALPRRTGASSLGVAAAGWVTLAMALALALVAAVFVAALLAQWPFMLAFATFLGVKVANTLPVLLVALWLAFAGRPRGWRSTLRDLGEWINRPLRLGTAAAVLAGGLVAVMVLARTGNISLPLSGAEQQLRTTLENLLVARPRTKEFFFGYPALVLAGVATALGWRRLALVCAAAGAVGTAGLINSFSHLHTPLLYSTWRTGNALALGAIVAVAPVVVLLWLRPRLRLS